MSTVNTFYYTASFVCGGESGSVDLELTAGEDNVVIFAQGTIVIGVNGISVSLLPPGQLDGNNNQLISQTTYPFFSPQGLGLEQRNTPYKVLLYSTSSGQPDSVLIKTGSETYCQTQTSGEMLKFAGTYADSQLQFQRKQVDQLYYLASQSNQQMLSRVRQHLSDTDPSSMPNMYRLVNLTKARKMVAFRVGTPLGLIRNPCAPFYRCSLVGNADAVCNCYANCVNENPTASCFSSCCIE